MENAASGPGMPDSFDTSLDMTVELDAGPGRHRIGLIALSSDYVTERDFQNMRPNDDVAIYVSRIQNANPCTVENLRTMAPLITDSVALILPDGRLDSVAYGCTSGTVAIGFDNVEASVHAVRPDIPVAAPITAGLAALRRFDAKRISVLTPYTDDVNAMMADYIQENGFDIADFRAFGFADDNDMAGITGRAIVQAAVQADTPESDALFISCTAIRAVDVVDEIEQTLGKPVVTANQALFWQALRGAGYEQPIQGYGQLLSRF